MYPFPFGHFIGSSDINYEKPAACAKIGLFKGTIKNNEIAIEQGTAHGLNMHSYSLAKTVAPVIRCKQSRWVYLIT